MEQIYNKVISVDEGDEDDGGLGEDPGLGEYPNDLMPDLPDLDQDLGEWRPRSQGGGSQRDGGGPLSALLVPTGREGPWCRVALCRCYADRITTRQTHP